VHESFDIRVAVEPGVEIDEDGCERGVQIQDAALTLEAWVRRATWRCASIEISSPNETKSERSLAGWMVTPLNPT